MFTFFNRFKWLSIPILIVLTIFGVSAVFYQVVHLTANRAYLIVRNFRLLTIMGDQITARIESYHDILRSAESLPKSCPDIRCRENLPTRKSYLESLGFEDVKENGLADDDQTRRREEQPRPGAFTATFSHPRLHVSYVFKSSDALRARSIQARILFDEKLGQITARSEFDDVIIAEERTGKVLFQREALPPRIENLNALRRDELKQFLSAKGETINGALWNQYGDSSTGAPRLVKNVPLAGIPYEVFLQPFTVPIYRTGGMREEPDSSKLVLAGLLRSERLQAESGAVSYTMLACLLLIVLIVVLCIPLLKLVHLDQMDRLQLRNILVLVYALVTGCAFLTLSLIDFYVYKTFEYRLDILLKKFAANIEQHFNDEFEKIAKQLNLLHSRLSEENAKVKVCNKPNALKEGLAGPKDPYPYWSVAFWADREGKQQMKWTVKKTLTPEVNLRNRVYFMNARDGQLWTRNKTRFWIERVYTWTTGEKLAFIATPRDKEMTSKFGPCIPQMPSVQVLGTRFLSLSDTVVPNGFGYAVIDSDGRVLFHSDDRRSLYENFFTENDNNYSLRSAVFARIDSNFDSRYWGRNHRFYVMPIQSLPWTIVTYRDKQFLTTANLEFLTISTVLLFFCLVVTGTVLWFAVSTKGAVQWAWPDDTRRSRYPFLTCITISLMAIFLATLLLGRLPPIVVLVLAVGLPLFGILLFYLVLQKTEGQNRYDTDRNIRARTDRRYMQALISLILLLSIAPTTGIFKIVYDEEVQLFLKHGLFSFARALQARNEKVAKMHLDIALPVENEANLFQTRMNLPWDTYGEFFFDMKHTNFSVAAPVDQGNALEEPNSLWDSIFEFLRPLYDEIAMETSGLARTTAVDVSWKWHWSVKEEAKDSQVNEDVCLNGTPDAKDHKGRRSLVLCYWGAIANARGGQPLGVVVSAPLPTLAEVLLTPVRSLLEQKHTVDATNSFRSMETAKQTVPKISEWEAAGLVVVTVGVLLVLLILLWHVLHFVWGKIFFVHFRKDPTIASSVVQNLLLTTEVKHNLLILLTDPRSRLQYANCFGSNTERIDLANRLSDKNWGLNAIRKIDTSEKNGAIVLLNFQYGMRDAGVTAQKLWLLEELVSRNKVIVVVSTAHPDIFAVSSTMQQQIIYEEKSSDGITNGQKQAGETEATSDRIGLSNGLERWRNIFSSFHVRYVDSPEVRASSPDELNQGTSAEDPTSQTSERATPTAKAYFRTMWETCSEDEQYVLYRRAIDGFVCAANPALQSLLARGILVLDPRLRFRSHDFQLFVSKQTPSEKIRSLERKTHQEWHGWMVSVILLVVVVVLFILRTQQDLFSEFSNLFGPTVPFVASVITAISPWLKSPNGMLSNNRESD